MHKSGSKIRRASKALFRSQGPMVRSLTLEVSAGFTLGRQAGLPPHPEPPTNQEDHSLRDRIFRQPRVFIGIPPMSDELKHDIKFVGRQLQARLSPKEHSG